MRKKILFVLSLIIFFLLTPKQAKAVVDCPFIINGVPSLTAPVESITISTDGTGILEETKNYPSNGQLKWSFPGVATCGQPNVTNISKPEITIGKNLGRCDNDLLSPGTHYVEIIYQWPDGEEKICNTKAYTVEIPPMSCKIEARYDGLGDVDDTTWRVVVWDIIAPKLSILELNLDNGKDKPQYWPYDFEKYLSKTRTVGKHTAVVYGYDVYRPRGEQMCETSFEIAPRGATPLPTTAPTPVLNCPDWCEHYLFNSSFPDYVCRYYKECDDNCYDCQKTECPDKCFTSVPTPGVVPDFGSIDCTNEDCLEKCLACGLIPIGPPKPTVALPDIEEICNHVFNNPNTPQNEKQDCLDCVAKGYAYTAIGCLPTDFSSLLKDYIFTYGLGIIGGIAFLLILYGGFTILTSAGNPENLAKGKEMITSAIAGLLIVIFSVFILKLIGVDILRIPGFGS